MEYKVNSCNYDIKEFIKKIKEEFEIDYWDEWLEEQDYDLLKINPNMLFSCEDNNKLIGICSIKYIDNNKCYLNSFYVDKDYRNKGIGEHLYNLCEKYAKDNNLKEIDLVVDPHFEDAIKFYEKRNYIFDEYDDERKELHYHKILEII